MNTTWKATYYLEGITVTPESDVITNTDASAIWEITVNGTQATIKNAASGYLYIEKSNTYYNIKLGENETDNKFTYELTTDKGWKFNSVTYTDRLLEYYISKTRWAFHTSADAPIYLYKQQSGGTTTYWTTAPNCTPVEPCVLTSITLNTDNAKTAFVEGEEFTFAGLQVTAHYSNCADKLVTDFTVVTPSMAVGTRDVTVSYTENEVTKTATYQITVTSLSAQLL